MRAAPFRACPGDFRCFVLDPRHTRRARPKIRQREPWPSLPPSVIAISRHCIRSDICRVCQLYRRAGRALLLLAVLLQRYGSAMRAVLERYLTLVVVGVIVLLVAGVTWSRGGQTVMRDCLENRSGSVGEPKVRIHLPPAASLRPLGPSRKLCVDRDVARPANHLGQLAHTPGG